MRIEPNKSNQVIQERIKDMKTKEFKLDTPREGFLNITRSVRETIKESGVQSGICVVYCAHTTAGITINDIDPEYVVVGETEGYGYEHILFVTQFAKKTWHFRQSGFHGSTPSSFSGNDFISLLFFSHYARLYDSVFTD